MSPHEIGFRRFFLPVKVALPARDQWSHYDKPTFQRVRQKVNRRPLYATPELPCWLRRQAD